MCTLTFNIDIIHCVAYTSAFTEQFSLQNFLFGVFINVFSSTKCDCSHMRQGQNNNDSTFPTEGTAAQTTFTNV